MNEQQNPLQSVATEFVTEAFETDASEQEVDSLAEAISEAVAELRSKLGDDRLEELLRDGEGAVLREDHSAESEDPEPLTAEKIIKPLFTSLGYPDPAVEVGDLSENRGKQADYSYSLREYDDIDSGRLLVEAEPLNKKLDQEKHGLGQVKDWLDRKKFDANFGIATNGLRWVLIKYDRDTYSYDTLADVNLQRIFIDAFENQTGRNVGLGEWVEGDDREVLATFIQSFGFDNFISIASEARAVIKETKEEITDEFYDEYVQYVFGIRPDGEGQTPRSLVGEGVIPPENATGDDVRLFAVELMNRLVFLKFLEDQRLVDEKLLEKLVSDHEGGMNPDSFYETYLEPLFVGILDEKPNDRTTRIQNIEVYTGVPYLNGGLFRPNNEWDGDVAESEFDVRDSVLLSIVDLLERHDFSADGGPQDLDPSVLGNVFEKTINHITGDAGDQKKELGAYYTPDEITRFCAEETVQPALLERFKSVVVEERDWPEAEVEQYEEVYDLIESLPKSGSLMDALLEEVNEFRALDPACGSGHFLTSVQSELVGIRKAIYDRRPSSEDDEEDEEDPPTWKLHKQTVVENVYGVDIVTPAVEIAKLRLWLSIITEVDPDEVADYDDDELALPNVVFNVRQGNSLIGYTDLMETSSDSDQWRLDAWGADTVREKYGEIIDLVAKHKATNDTEEAQTYLQEAEELLDEYRDDLDEKVLVEFQDAEIDVSLEQVRNYDPFHWVLEFAPVYADGGFDTIVGNPPWEVLSVNRDDFFSKHNSNFRNFSSSEKDDEQERLLNEEDLTEEWEKYKRGMENRADYFNNSSAYKLQSPTIDGRAVASENDLSALFLERVFDLSRDAGRVALVLPGNIFNGAASKDLRMKLLDDSQIHSLVEFENHGIFKDIDNRYQFGVTVFESEKTTEKLRGIFQQRKLDILQEFEEKAIEIPRRVLTEYSPKARIFPYVTSQIEVDVLNKILSKTPLEEQNQWWADILTKELHETSDKHLFVTSENEGDYPVYGGKNINQYCYNPANGGNIKGPEYWGVGEDDKENSAKYRVREKKFNIGDLKKAIYTEFKDQTDIRASSQVQFVDSLLERHRDRGLEPEDILLDCREYRIAYRDVARATDERTMIATVLPPEYLCLHTVQTLKPNTISPEKAELAEFPLHSAYSRIFTDTELFVAVGLFNSLPFDFLMRTKIDSHMVKYKIEESQMPRLTAGDDWFTYISTRAAKLNCYGEGFAEMRDRLGGIDAATDPEERQRLQAEIDAAAFHAYGLDREETRFVLDDFHRVRDPRMMTEEYFDLVAATYDELAEEGPMD